MLGRIGLGVADCIHHFQNLSGTIFSNPRWLSPVLDFFRPKYDETVLKDETQNLLNTEMGDRNCTMHGRHGAGSQVELVLATALLCIVLIDSIGTHMLSASKLFQPTNPTHPLI